jgi:hypothetical protein
LEDENMQKFKKVIDSHMEPNYQECDWCFKEMDSNIWRTEVRDKKWLKNAGSKMPPKRRFGVHFKITGEYGSEFDMREFAFDICDECFKKHLLAKSRNITPYMRMF